MTNKIAPTTGDQSWSLIFDSAALAMALCDREGNVVRANAALLEWSGFRSDELSDSSFQPLCGDPQIAQAARSLIDEGGATATVESEVVHKDGSIVPVEARLSRVELPDGPCVLTVLLDNSSREAEHKRFEKSERRFKTVFDSAPIAMAIKDADNRNVMVNPAMEKLLGRTGHELIGHMNKEFLSPGHDYEGLDRFRAMVDGQFESVTFERPLQKGDGSLVWTRGLNTAVRDDDGSFLYAVQVIEDTTDAREREQALAASEQRFRTLFEQSPIGITILSADRTVLEANATAMKMLGRPDLIGQRFWDFAYETDGVDRFQTIESRGIGIHVAERQLKPHPGAVGWVQYTTAAVTDENGEFLYAVRMIEDITERKQSEVELAASEERFRSLFESAPIGIRLTDPEHEAVTSNDALAKILRRDREDLDSHPLTDFWHPDHSGEFVRTRPTVEAGEDFGKSVERVFAGPDGEPIWTKMTVTGVRNENGSLKQVIRMIEDLTEREHTERELKASELRFRSFFESAPIALAIKDSNARNVMVNPAMEELFGRSASELLGKRNKEYLAPDFVQRKLNSFDAIVNGNHSDNVWERAYTRSDGSTIWALGKNTPIRDENGTFLYMVQSLQDITPIREREEQLKASEQRFRALFEQAPFGLAILGVDREILDANESLSNMLAKPIERLVGTRFYGYYEDPGRVNQYREIYDGGLDTHKVERRLMQGLSDTEWVQATTAAVRDEEGTLLYSMRMLEDITDRKRAEAKLAASEERFRSLFESAPIGIRLVNPDDHQMESNAALARILGREFEEVEPALLSSFWHPDHASSFETTRANLVAGADSETVSRVFAGPSGEEIWAKVTSSAVRDESGTLKQIVRMVEDVTEQRRAEVELKDSERRFRELFEKSPMGITVLAKDRTVLEANEAALKMMGRPDLVGQRFIDMTSDADGANRYGQLVEQRGGVHKMERRLIPHPGAAEWLQFTTTPVVDDEGHFQYGLRMLEDISDRKRAEAELADREVFLQALIDHIPEGLVVMDENGKYAMMNRPGAEMMGYTPEQVVGMYCWDFLPDDPDVAESIKAEIPFNEHTPDSENEAEAVARKDGSSFPCRTTNTHFQSNGKTHRLSIWKDLTQQREAEARITNQIRRDAEADERERVARDLHDTVVQDLTGIALRLEYAVKMSKSGNADLTEYLDETERLGRAAIRSSRDAVWNLWSNIPVDGPLGRFLEGEAQKELNAAGISFSIQETGEARMLPRNVHAGLGRVLREALNNVVRHAQAHSVRISVRYDPETVTLDIADDGVGMKTHNRQPGDAGGFGVMSMYERARLIGGTVELKPREGGGTVVTVTVPC